MMRPAETDLLLIVDVQVCFTAGGSLAVPEGERIIPLVNRLAERFTNVILTQDWHPPDHNSFASQHAGAQPFDEIVLRYGRQVLWPDHCVQGTRGAKLHPGLHVPHAQLILRKGYQRDIDSYSAFVEADGSTRTGLDGYLRTRSIQRLFLVGLATDFCVAFSAVDARRLGFAACVIEDATRALDIAGSLTRAWEAMRGAGVERISTAHLADMQPGLV